MVVTKTDYNFLIINFNANKETTGMNTEKEAEILEMHDNGVHINSIAEEMGLSTTAIRNVLKKHGRATFVKKPIHDEEAIINQYLQQMPMQDILEEHQLTYSMLYGILAKHQVAPRRIADADSRQHRLDAAIKMYQEHYALWEIARETGIAQPTLHAELHKRGMQLRRNFTRAGSQSILPGVETSDADADAEAN